MISAERPFPECETPVQMPHVCKSELDRIGPVAADLMDEHYANPFPDSLAVVT